MSSKQPVLDNKFQANLDYNAILSPKQANKHKQISEEALEPQTTRLNSSGVTLRVSLQQVLHNPHVIQFLHV